MSFVAKYNLKRKLLCEEEFYRFLCITLTSLAMIAFASSTMRVMAFHACLLTDGGPPTVSAKSFQPHISQPEYYKIHIGLEWALFSKSWSSKLIALP